ncbi:MAG: hypothetical protein PHG53_09720 [Phycisphaerae bacterium]|nr:hypothetical protein [Phycisphaerae bacterium]
MKKLTLDKTWYECLRMWRDIVHSGYFKEEWLEKSGYEDELYNNCFFCEWAKQHRGGGLTCDACPAKEIDAEFECGKEEYDYLFHPDLFLAKLEELNKIRLSKKCA